MKILFQQLQLQNLFQNEILFQQLQLQNLFQNQILFQQLQLQNLFQKEKQKKIDEIMTKNLTDFTKDPYKSYTKNQSLKKIKTKVLNALVNEINYPLTKDVLGIKLTKDLKEKISKLNSEAAIGLTWIIRALVLSNTKKLPVYYENNNYFQLSKKEIKEIIEYYFITLAILLNPAQKY